MKNKLLVLFMSFALFYSLAGCESKEANDKESNDDIVEPIEPIEPNEPSVPQIPIDPVEPDTPIEPIDESYSFSSATGNTLLNLSQNGYALNKISDFSIYNNTDAYKTVSNATELINAITLAKYNYTSSYDEATNSVVQVLNKEGRVHVIEITSDIDLAYNHLSQATKSNSIVTSFIKSFTPVTDTMIESGISQIKIENISNLLIYSKNGSKITRGGFKLTSCNNVVFRNLSFDEMWEWEDSSSANDSKIGDYDKFGWAYFKIGFCGYIWIDHCSFGKSYDGQIDYSNPVSNTLETAFRAPYGSDSNNGLHISFCSFNNIEYNESSYLYQMMEKIEKSYNDNEQRYLYYNALRDSGYSFLDILYALAIPQKKGFLLGDDAKYPSNDYLYNKELKVSFDSCYFKNIEDRLPKLRGGNAIISNSIVDSEQYYTYRAKLKQVINGKTAVSAVSSINSSWKCALVSQGLLVGNGGSLLAQNCIFKGIETLIKNNDTKNTAPYNYGAYDIVNCSYKQNSNSSTITGSKVNKGAFQSSNVNLSNDFTYNTSDGLKPYNINSIDVKELNDYLLDNLYGVGVKLNMTEWLKSNY